MTLDIEDKKYIKSSIDKSIERALSRHDHKMQHYMGALKEGFMDQIKILAELISDKPGREEVRQIVREEIHYERSKLMGR